MEGGSRTLHRHLWNLGLNLFLRKQLLWKCNENYGFSFSRTRIVSRGSHPASSPSSWVRTLLLGRRSIYRLRSGSSYWQGHWGALGRAWAWSLRDGTLQDLGSHSPGERGKGPPTLRPQSSPTPPPALAQAHLQTLSLPRHSCVCVCVLGRGGGRHVFPLSETISCIQMCFLYLSAVSTAV